MVLSRSSLGGIPHTASRAVDASDLVSIIAHDRRAELGVFLNNNPDEFSEVTLDGKSLLMRLIETGAKLCAEYLLKTFPDKCNTEKQDTSGATAMHLAAKKGFAPVVRLLPCNDTILLHADRNSMTPLHIAANEGHEDIVDYFCSCLTSDEAKLKVFQPNTTTPLHLAVKTSYVSLSYLLRIAPDKDVVDSSGKTALHLAVESPIADDCVLTLVNANANPNVVDRNGHTPLTLAIGRKSEPTARLLLSRSADPNLGRIHPLIHAFLQNSSPLFSLLITHGAKPEQAVLYTKPLSDILVALGEITFLRALPTNKFSFSFEFTKTIQDTLQNDKIVEFCYFLHAEQALSRQCPELLLIATLKANTFALQLLIHHGFDPNWQDAQGNSCLHHAPTEEIADLLLQHGAKRELKNAQGQTPLLRAYATGRKQVFAFLLKKGANPDAVDSSESTLLEQCVAMGNYNDSETLVKHGATRTPKSLIFAIQRVSLELTELLTSTSVFHQNRQVLAVDPNKPYMEITPLVCAIEMLYQKISEEAFTNPSVHHKIKEMVGFTIFQKLLQEGAAVNATSAHVVIREKQIRATAERTAPLIIAAERNLAEIVRELLNNGARPKTVNGKHPVPTCAEKNFSDSLYELLSHGAKIPKKSRQNMAAYPSHVQNMLQEYLPKTRSLSKRIGAITLSSSKQPPPTVGSQTLDQRRGAFYKVDTFQEAVLREKNIIAGTPLLFKHSRLFPGSMCRLAACMDIKVQGKPIINKNDTYPEGSSRDQKAAIIVGKILQAIHPTLGLHLDEKAFCERVRLMSKMDAINDKEIETLDIYKDGRLQPHNADMIALRLIAKEAALMAVLPVQLQIRNYAEKHDEIAMRPFMRDQWEEIDIVKKNDQFEAFGKTTMGIGVALDGSQTMVTAATVQIDQNLLSGKHLAVSKSQSCDQIWNLKKICPLKFEDTSSQH